MIHHPQRWLIKAAILIPLFACQVFSQWEQQVSNSPYNLYSVYFINSNTGFMCSSSQLTGKPNQFYGGEILRTTNAGVNWSRVLLDSAFRGKGFWFINQNTGFAVGGVYTQLGRILKTTDGGSTWSGDSLVRHVFNVQFLNDQTGYCGIFDGVIKTTNGGSSWQRMLEAGNQYVTWGKVFFTSTTTGFYTVNNGNIYKTVNGGSNWNINNINAGYIYDIKFINASTGFISADSGRIYKTINEGSSWFPLVSGLTQALFSISLAGPDILYITGENTILKSTNTGSSWFTVFNFPADTLFSSYFLNANTGYTCGDDGRVYKTTTGGVIGIEPVSTEMPEKFTLEQNYPNPFNPATNIKFAVPRASFVRLVVYDMLGREVESLVNQQLTAGIYVVDWNAAKFSSGVYLYKLITNDFNMVKKMSLIK